MSIADVVEGAARLVTENAVVVEPSAPNACPPGFVAHAFETDFTIAAPRERVWAWLEDPETFTKGQLGPYRVEFVSTDPETPPGFHPGGLNVHHGPLLSLAGQLTEIREGRYRALRYFYGSYVLSLRLIRPTQLEFWVVDEPNGRTRVKLRLQSYVRRPIERLWGRVQHLFWQRFPRWMARALDVSLV